MKKQPKVQEETKPTNIHNYIVLLIFTGYLSIDFFPNFGSGDIMAPQFLYLNVLNIIVAGYIFFFRKEYDFQVNQFINRRSIFSLYLIFLLLCAVSLVFSNNITLSLMTLSQLIVVLMIVINFTLLLLHKKHLINAIIFLIAISAFLQAGKVLASLGSITDVDTITEFYKSKVRKGNTGNINIFAASMLFKVSFILIGIIRSTSYKKWFFVITLFMTTAVIFLINARTTLVSITLVFLAFSVYYFKLSQNAKDNNKNRNSLFFYIPLIAAFILANIVMSNYEGSSRYTSTLQRATDIKLGGSGAEARFLYWENALKIAAENPLVGVGIGNWRVESIPYEPPVKKSISLNAHNDYFEILAETGFINGIVYAALFIFLLIINGKRVLKPRDESSQILALIALLVLIVYGLDASLNFPLYRPTMQLAFAFLLALTLINTPFKENAKPLNFNKHIILLFLALAPLYVSYAVHNSLVMETKIKTDPGADDLTKKSIIKAKELVDHNPKIPNVLLSTTGSYNEYIGYLFYKEENYKKSKHYFIEADKVNPYLGKAPFYRYLIAQKEGLADSAYHFLKTSFYRRARDYEVYKIAVLTAATRKDTAEALKMYKHYNAIHKNPIAINELILALRTGNYDYGKLLAFLENERQEFKENKDIDNAVVDSVFAAAYTNLGNQLK